MRQIKFRAWDADEKKMCHKVYVGPEGWHGEYWTDGMMTSCFSDINHADNTLMQFTGLHDKNGKEIWEGDILAHTSWVQNKANGSPQDDFSDNQVIEGVPLHLNKNPYPVHRDFIWNPYRVVEYVAHDEFYQATGYFSPFVGGCKPKEYEVLGNIYENPELLK